MCATAASARAAPRANWPRGLYSEASVLCMGGGGEACVFVCLSASVYVCVSVRLSACLSVCLSVIQCTRTPTAAAPGTVFLGCLNQRGKLGAISDHLSLISPKILITKNSE